ncbi:Kelch repeat-containing protein [Streptomyces sp. SP18CS02]|uniref:Kelch repeat-containing protein n=1 Tax=Streptomyces sp. SP18CS02 TaxID=3002531 RepID=UPI002E766D6D|nr:kelch repeat-containing protein [Streptomyces sp. SP18CS02]MEE1753178.1 kelch repeat-containing protein [Streptomyces sp. SP18CS02]
MRIFSGSHGGTRTGSGRRRWTRRLFTAALTSLLASTGSLAHAEGVWVTAPVMQQARSGHGTTTAPCPEAVPGLGQGSCVYVIGGHPLEAALSAHAYSPETKTWATLPSMTVGRSGLAAVTAPCPRSVAELRGPCVYAVGGTNGGGSLDRVEAYSPATNKWVTLPSMSTGRGFLGGAAAPCPVGVASLRGTCVYVVGGTTISADATKTSNTVEAYSPVTNSWATVASLPTARRSLGVASASCPRGKGGGSPLCVYAIGGSDTGEPLGAVESYNPLSGKWSALAAVPTARRGMGVTSGPCPEDAGSRRGSCVYGIGGSPTAKTSAVGTVEVFAPGSGTWKALPSLPQARFGFGATAAPCSDELSRTCLYAPGGALGTAPSTEHTAFDVVGPAA